MPATPISADALWEREREASDQLTGEMLRYAERRFEAQIVDAWEDFHLGPNGGPFEAESNEVTIFLPYFLFHWIPYRAGRRSKAQSAGGVIARSFLLEHGNRLSELQRQILEQAMTQPISFYEVLSSEPGVRIALRDILTGWEADVMERKGSESVKPGDIVYAQVWSLPDITTLGCSAPIRIPPDRKAEIIGLRKRLRRRVAKQNRGLNAEDLVRYAEEIRETYLDIRDSLNAPPRLQNTDGDPLVFHTLTFRIESAEATFEALAPLAVGRSKEDLLSDAELDKNGKLRRVEFAWLEKGNRRFTTWENTILGNIRISKHSLVAEVNSEQRAARLRREIEKRLGPLAAHLSTLSQTPETLLKNAPKRKTARAKLEDAHVEELLRDPEVRKRAQESMQKEAEAWVYRKIPVLGGRTPMQAVQEPDGREIVEALLLQFERRADEGAFPRGIRPDIDAVRRLLNLAPPSS